MIKTFKWKLYLLRLKTKNSYFQNYKQIFVLSLWLIRFKKYNKSYYSFFSRFQDIVRSIHVRHLKNFLLNDLICHKKLFISLKILIFRSTFIKTLLNTIFLFRLEIEIFFNSTIQYNLFHSRLCLTFVSS